MFQVFKTKEEATIYAKREYSELQLETECVNVIKIGTTAAKFYGVDTGYAIDLEINSNE